MMIRDGTRRRVASQQEKMDQAQQIASLKTRWLAFPFPVQEMLKLHLHLYGMNSVQDVTDILERLSKAMKGIKHL